MSGESPVVYTDDPDRHWSFKVDAEDGVTNVDWANPKAATKDGTYTISASWLGSPSPSRHIDVPLVSITVPGYYTLFLQVPGNNDIELGKVSVNDRD